MLDNAQADSTPSSTAPDAAGNTAQKATFELLELAARFRHPAAVAALLEACIIESDGDAQIIARTLAAIVHAQGVRDFSQRSGVSCRQLRRELTGRRPTQFATVLQVTRTLGLTLHVSATGSDGRWPPAR